MFKGEVYALVFTERIFAKTSGQIQVIQKIQIGDSTTYLVQKLSLNSIGYLLSQFSS